jgi:Tol biopolymer transport system component
MTPKKTALPTVQLLEPGEINSTYPEFGGSLSRKADRFFFNRTDSTRAHIELLYSERKNNAWQMAVPIRFSDTSIRDVDPFVTAKGDFMYFSSDRTHPDLPAGYNLWYSSQQDGEWSNPLPLDTLVNSGHDEVYCSLALNGTIYFARFEGNQSHIYFARPHENRFTAPVRLNIPLADTIRINNPAISPDESYILFVSAQLNGVRNPDIYISRRLRLGTNSWSSPENLGPKVNSSSVEFAPFISPDQKWLYFTSERPGIVQDYPPRQRRPGDIYRIRLDKLF